MSGIWHILQVLHRVFSEHSRPRPYAALSHIFVAHKTYCFVIVWYILHWCKCYSAKKCQPIEIKSCHLIPRFVQSTLRTRLLCGLVQPLINNTYHQGVCCSVAFFFFLRRDLVHRCFWVRWNLKTGFHMDMSKLCCHVCSKQIYEENLLIQ